MDRHIPQDPWPEVMQSVVGRVTAVEPARSSEPPRAWIGAVGPLQLPIPSMLDRMTPDAYVRVAYHRERGVLVADQVRSVPPAVVARGR